MLAAALASLLITAPPADKLSFLDTVAGRGQDKVEKGDVISAGYRGWLYESGVEFDSSKTKAPISFRVGDAGVIRAWQEGLLGMTEGAHRILLAPPAFGYGKEGNGPIPANATLGFDIQILRVDKKGNKAVLAIQEKQAGDGLGAKDGDKLEIHYTGTFLNGVKFDSSRDRGQTFNITLGTDRVIKGFEQGLRGMKQGQRRIVTIPYDLAYGEKGAGAVIPPFATLVFDLEIVKIGRA